MSTSAGSYNYDSHGSGSETAIYNSETDRPVSPRSYMTAGPRPVKMYRIGEIIDYSGLSRQTIHNYTAMGLLKESRWTPGGHRLYDESVFDRLDNILSMKRQRKTMREIMDYFDAADSDSTEVATN